MFDFINLILKTEEENISYLTLLEHFCPLDKKDFETQFKSFLIRVRSSKKKAFDSKVISFVHSFGKNIDEVLESDLAKIYWKKAEAAKISLMSGALQSRINSQSYDNSLQIAEKSIQRQLSHASDKSEESLVSSQESNDKHPKRVYTYTVAGYDTEIAVAEKDRWYLNGLDVTTELIDFRNVSVKYADKSKDISDLRLMSLDHIYFFTATDKNESVTKYLLSSLSKAVFSYLATKYKPTTTQISMRLVTWANTLASCSGCSSWNDIMSSCLKISAEAKDTQDQTEIVFCYLIFSMSNIPVTQSNLAEDSHVHTYLACILKAFFCTDSSLSVSWANKKLDNSSEKPDFSVSFLPWNNSFTLLTCEVKLEKTVSVLKDGYLSDFVKTAKQMKTNLEGMVAAGVDNPLSFGIVNQGMSLSLLIMNVENKAVYTLYEFSRIELIKSVPDYIRLPQIIQEFTGFKNLMNSVVSNIEAVELTKSKGRAVKRSVSFHNLRTESFSYNKRAKKA